MSSIIDVKTVGQLEGYDFFIPRYQRGYRWRRNLEVKDLLDDLWLFMNGSQAGYYCLQPLVVAKRVKKDVLDKLHAVNSVEEASILLRDQWEVIDGQQRLTTLSLILSYLGKSSYYSLDFETRRGGKKFLDTISESYAIDKTGLNQCAEKNIDFFRMYDAYDEVNEWFEEKSGGDGEMIQHNKEKILDIVKSKVQFIWYVADGEKAIDVFTRLNIGKIGLTNAELIKALLLNRSSFKDKNGNSLRESVELERMQSRIADRWDAMERRLQDDSFWLYLRPSSDKRSTRIDYILELVAERKLNDVHIDDNGIDDLMLFRKYERHFRTSDSLMNTLNELWCEVDRIFNVLEEWFDDSILYHYTGYIVATKEGKGKSNVIADLLSAWDKADTRTSFIAELERRIKDTLQYLKKQSEKQRVPILDVLYDTHIKEDGTELESVVQKQACRPILLLHNILTVIKQGEFLAKNEKYRGQRVFYKFPFNLYKKEDWDIEHIDSNTENGLSDLKSQVEWLLNALPCVSNANLRDRIASYCRRSQINQELFDGLLNDCLVIFQNETANGHLSPEERNRIWNFALLDGDTNSGYRNAIFPAKRRIIMAKERGIKQFNPKLEGNDVIYEEEPAQSPFVAPCTKQVFLKYYTGTLSSMLTWNIKDAQAYKDDIEKMVSGFLQ